MEIFCKIKLQLLEIFVACIDRDCENLQLKHCALARLVILFQGEFGPSLCFCCDTLLARQVLVAFCYNLSHCYHQYICLKVKKLFVASYFATSHIKLKMADMFSIFLKCCLKFEFHCVFIVHHLGESATELKLHFPVG